MPPPLRWSHVPRPDAQGSSALTGGVNGAIAEDRKAGARKAEAALLAAEAKPRSQGDQPRPPSTHVALNITDDRNFAGDSMRSPPMW
ncbi:hypothetical protein ACXX9E_28725 [Pseudomonas sp. GNP014]